MPIIKDRLLIEPNLGGGPAKWYRLKYIKRDTQEEFQVETNDKGEYEIDLPYGDYDVFTALPLKETITVESEKLRLEIEEDPDIKALIQFELDKKKNIWEKVNPGFLHSPDEIEQATEKWQAYFDES